MLLFGQFTYWLTPHQRLLLPFWVYTHFARLGQKFIQLISCSWPFLPWNYFSRLPSSQGGFATGQPSRSVPAVASAYVTLANCSFTSSPKCGICSASLSVESLLIRRVCSRCSGSQLFLWAAIVQLVTQILWRARWFCNFGYLPGNPA